ncbi:MAG TPA: hypothetical protein VGD67_02475, partial [Pseudonocardiaceae bacterium]
AAAEGIATVAALYVRPGPLAGALREAGFTAVPMTPSWELRLPGGGLAGYLAALPHKRRIEARRELRLLADAGVRIEPVADVDAVFDDLVRLRGQLVAKYRGATREPAAERARLRTLVDDVAGGRPRVLLARGTDGAPLGFALFAEHSEAEHSEAEQPGAGSAGRARSWHCLAVGHDYTDPRSRLTYFGTAYYRAAEHAYQDGVRTLGYGIGAWRAKRARGCRPSPRTGWVHTTDPALAATVRATAEVTELADL